MSMRRQARVNSSAIAENVALIARTVAPAQVMAVVKADAYGHGALGSARAALRGGAGWLGTADLDEARALRKAGITAPILCWMHGADTDFDRALAENIDIAVSSIVQLEAVILAAERAGAPARVHLKLETGLSRNGVAPEDWESLCVRAAEAESTRALEVVGVMSHLSNTGPEEDRAQIARFDWGLGIAEAAGLRPSLRHLAATAGALDLPESRFDLVRIGLGIYGLAPETELPVSRPRLRPALTLTSEVIAVRRVPSGTGVSYGYRHRTERETTLALIPLGYADGIPRHASNRAPVRIGEQTFLIAGQIAMDQFIVDIGDAPVAVGDVVTLIGDPALGNPSADDWATAADTINYEIVTRLGGRITREYEDQ